MALASAARMWRICSVVGVAAAIELQRPSSADAQPWKIDFTRPLTEIGEHTSPDLQWRRIVGAVRLMSGEVLVGVSEGRVLRFSPRGQFAGVAMQRGRGPVELPGLSALLPLGDAAVAIHQGQFVMLGGPSSESGGIPSAGGPPSANFTSVLLGGSVAQLRSGWRMLAPPTRIVDDSATLIVWTKSGTDTLGRVLSSQGLILASASLPQGVAFGRIEGAKQFLVAGRDSTIWYGVNDQPAITRVTVRNGRVLSPVRIPLALSRLPWTAERRAAWEKTAFDLAETEEKRELVAALWSARSLPAEMPVFRSIVGDVDGGLWIELFPPDPSRARDFLILSGRGRQLGRVSVPSDIRIAHISSCCLTAIRRDADDIESVVVYPITRGR